MADVTITSGGKGTECFILPSTLSRSPFKKGPILQVVTLATLIADIEAERVAAASSVYSKAFETDPVITYLLSPMGSRSARLAYLPAYFKALLTAASMNKASFFEANDFKSISTSASLSLNPLAPHSNFGVEHVCEKGRGRQKAGFFKRRSSGGIRDHD